MKNYETLNEKINEFESRLQKRTAIKQERKQKRKEQLAQLQQYIEQKTNSMVSKIQDLKRKETILITLKKIEPQIPQNFPKNYFCQIVYQDALLTGNQKYTDFDENIIQEKFVLPLLFSTVVKIQVWTAEEEPTLFDKGEINLEKDIESAIIADKYEGEINLEKLEGTTLSYQLQIQGIGFSSWLKNIAEMRELQAQKAYSHQRVQMKREIAKKKISEKKEQFNQKFQNLNNQHQETEEYKIDQLNDILTFLKD